jgi:diguanylate cyclase (GGDEF)-like protein/PAS domain S-box-containing protein
VTVAIVATGIAAKIAALPTPAGGHGAVGLVIRRAKVLLTAGVGLSMLCTVAAGVTSVLAPRVRLPDQVPLPAEIPNVGLFFVVAAFVSGQLLLLDSSTSLARRLRRLLDGVGVGICGFFTVWTLLWSRIEILGAALTAVLVACVTAGGVTAAVTEAPLFRGTGGLTALGVVTTVAGQAALTVGVDYQIGQDWSGAPGVILGSGLLLVAGPQLILHGFRAILRTVAAGPPRGTVDGPTAHPLLALPAAGALIAAVYHLVDRGTFDPVAGCLCLAGIAVVVARETLTAIDLQRLTKSLVSQETRFRSLFAGSTNVTFVLDRKLIVRWQSPAVARLLGLSEQEVIGEPFPALLHPTAGPVTLWLGEEAPTNHEVRLRDGFGGWRDLELQVTDYTEQSGEQLLVVHAQDVNDRRRWERTLHRAVFADDLTTLPNRRELIRVLLERPPTGVVMTLSLDGIAGINDAHGRQTGDVVLVEAARRLRESLSPGDLAARLDGGTFAVVTEGGAMHAHLLATRLLTVLSQPYPTPLVTAHVSARAGLAEIDPSDGCRADPDEVLRRAGLALRRTRRSGADGEAVEWHDAAMEAEVRRQVAIEHELSAAVERGSLELRYQPVIDLTTDRPVGVEAVLLLRHPEFGVVPAAEMLPIAEEIGVASQVVEWGLRRSCRQLATWLADGHDLWMAVDVPAVRAAATTFPGSVTTALEAHDVAPSRLLIEIAEAGLNAGPPAAGGLHAAGADALLQSIIGNLSELRSLGVQVAVDHFGTAATSLSHLRVLPVDLLKVDRQLFTEPSGKTGPATAIIDVMVRFSHQLGVAVAAQGLIEEADLTVARAAGCRYGQGDLLSPAVPAEYLEAFLDRRRVHRF